VSIWGAERAQIVSIWDAERAQIVSGA